MIIASFLLFGAACGDNTGAPNNDVANNDVANNDVANDGDHPAVIHRASIASNQHASPVIPTGAAAVGG